MEDFMIALWNMSIQASLAVLVVLVVREIFRWLRIPKKYAYVLWMIPFIRLICPWSLESVFSILPSRSKNVISSGKPENPVFYVRGDGSASEAWNGSDVISAQSGTNGTVQPGSGSPAVDGMQLALTVAGVIWAVVLLLLVAYSIISYQKLRRRTQCAMRLKDNIYLVDHLETAFVMGFFRPRICLPSGLSSPEQRLVIAHEETHIRRRDHWVKLLAYFITCIHWFNPLAWTAFYFLGKDMEMSCDEAVLRRMGRGIRGEYATALLRLTAGSHRLSGVPLAFGEGNTKGRITHIMRYKKPALAGAIVAAGALAVLAAALLTDPKSVSQLEKIEELSMGLPAEEGGGEPGGVLLRMDGETADFAAAYQEIFTEYLKHMEVSREPVDASYGDGADQTVELQFINGGRFCFAEDMSAVWCETEEAVSEPYRIQDPEALREFLRKQTGSIEGAEEAGQPASEVGNAADDASPAQAVDVTKIPYGEVELEPPVLELGMVMGSDGVQLDYADEDRIIFHDWFGMFVYDMEVKQFVGAVDLAQIGCGNTQGDNACEVWAASDGGTVYLHPARDEGMFIYRVETNTVTRERYDISGIDMFDDFLDTREMVQPDYTMYQSERCVALDTQEGVCYGLIESAGMIESISFVGYEKGSAQQIFHIDLFANLSQASQGYTADSRMYSMTVKEGSVTAGGLELQIFNHADEPMLYGADYHLQRLENGNWEEFAHWDSKETQYTHPGGGSMISISIDWSGLCGELTPGSYRIVKTASVSPEAGPREEIELSAEFEVE